MALEDLSLNEPINTEEMKFKLINIGDYADIDENVHCYATYLANNMNSELVPNGFIISALRAIEDFRCKGIIGNRRKIVPEALIGHRPEFYNGLKSLIPDIAAVVCPSGFAKEVARIVEKEKKYK